MGAFLIDYALHEIPALSIIYSLTTQDYPRTIFH